MITWGIAFWYSLPRKKGAWEEQLDPRGPGASEDKGQAWGDGCSAAQAGRVSVWNLITQKLCSSLPGCQSWDLSSSPMSSHSCFLLGLPQSLLLAPSSVQVSLLLVVHPGELSPPTALWPWVQQGGSQWAGAKAPQKHLCREGISRCKSGGN